MNYMACRVSFRYYTVDKLQCKQERNKQQTYLKTDKIGQTSIAKQRRCCPLRGLPLLCLVLEVVWVDTNNNK